MGLGAGRSGAGPIGLATVAGAVALGAEVDAVDLDATRAGRAADLGAGTQRGRDYDVVVDAAGTASSLRAAVAATAPGGTVALVATHWSPVPIGIEVQLREVSLVPAYLYGCHHGRHELDLALDLLASSDLARIAITHRVDLDDAAAAFDTAANDPSAGKVVLVPGR